MVGYRGSLTGRAMDIDEAHKPELEDLEQDIAPEEVLETIEEQERQARLRNSAQ